MKCPLCYGPIEEVRRPSDSQLNEGQFDAVKCGDYYCDRCRRYLWLRLVPNENHSSHSLRPKTDHVTVKKEDQ